MVGYFIPFFNFLIAVQNVLILVQSSVYDRCCMIWGYLYLLLEEDNVSDQHNFLKVSSEAL